MADVLKVLIAKERIEQILEVLEGVDLERLKEIVNILEMVRERGGTAWLAGNGGSAATCGHLANDLVKACGMRAIALPDQTALVTAYANDVNYGEVYAEVVKVMGEVRDCAVGISCSGNSENVVRFMEEAKKKGMLTIGLAGDGGRLAGVKPTALIKIPGRGITIQEDVHLVICHTIVEMIWRM